MNQKEPEKLPFDSPEFAKAWAEWIEYRKEKRLPKYVPRGLKMTFTKLVNESGHESKMAIAMIESAMANNYQGIHPIKPNYGNNTGITADRKPGTSAARIAAARKF